MNLLLIFPPFPHGSYSEKDQPLGLAVLYACVVKTVPNATVEFLDLNVQPLTISSIISKIKREKWDVIGISYVTPQASFAYSLSKRLKKECPDVIIIHGGPHPTCMPHEAIKVSDFVVIGEGDISFIQLLETLKRGENPPAGVWGHWKGTLITSDAQEFVKDLDAFPFPQRVLERYDHTIHLVPGYAASLMASRGCPNACTFCCSPKIWKRTVRYRSPLSVIAEIQELVKMGIRKVHFYDDDFLLNPHFVRTFCQLVAEENLSIQWVCLASTRAVINRPQLLPLMVDAGCAGIEIGIESGDSHVLSQVSKPQSLNDIKKAVQTLSETGVPVLPLFMTFNPGETLQGHRKQKLFLDTLFPERIQRSLFSSSRKKEVYLGQFATPYPGSRFFEMKESLGVTLHSQWWNFVSTKINFIPYSLLQDRPGCCSPNVDDYIEVVDALFYKFPSAFGSGIKRVKRARSITAALKTFFSLCNGKKSLQDIALSLEKEYNCRRRTALKFAAIAGVVASQCGVFARENNQNSINPVVYCLYSLYMWVCLRLGASEPSVKDALTALVGG